MEIASDVEFCEGKRIAVSMVKGNEGLGVRHSSKINEVLDDGR